MLRSVLRVLWRSVLVAVTVLVLEFLVVPQLVGASRSLHLLGRMRPSWVLLGVLLEAVSLFCYSLLTRSLLADTRPRLLRLFLMTLSTTGASHVGPAGPVTSSGLAVQLLTADGVAPTDAGFVVVAEALWSAVVLNVLLWFALLVSIPLAGFRPVYLTVAVLGLLAMLCVAALVLAFTRGKEHGMRLVRWVGRRIPRVGATRLEQAARQIADLLSQLARSPAGLARATLWAALNWLLDAASLEAFLAAFGHPAHPVELFVAYGIGNVLAVIPLVPGGLGIIEASTASLLVSFGLPASVATLGVLGWRLVSFWLLIPVGGAAYLALRIPTGAAGART